MNVVAVVGSPRKGRATDLLVDRAIEGVKSVDPDAHITKLHLTDYDIKYCRNCLVCRESKSVEPVAKCTIRDDMDTIRQYLLDADALIYGTPVHSGYPTGPMMTFIERTTWIFAKPEGRVLTVKGCPVPRSDRRRKAAIIVVSGIVPPLYRSFCDSATPLIREMMKSSLNATTVGSLYAGAIETRGVERYLEGAYRLGRKLG